jgi:hypothetical protein
MLLPCNNPFRSGDELEEVIVQGAKLADVGVKMHGICGRAHCHEPVLEARPSNFDGWRAGKDPQHHEAPVPLNFRQNS